MPMSLDKEFPGFSQNEAPPEAISDKLLQISEEYSHIPPSPGDTRSPFADDNLGDTMAAEFGDPAARHQSSLATSSSGSDHKLVADELHENGFRGEMNTVIAEAGSSENGGISDRGDALAETQLVEEAASDNVMISRGPSTVEAANGASASGPVVTTVNEEERELSGPSSLGGVMLFDAIATVEGEGQSRKRILSFAAKRYANAVQRNPQDYDALYNWALVLQESADNTSGDSTGTVRDRLLEEACAKYRAATELCPSLHEAFYNWAIAISDRAKARGRTKEAEDLWKQACKRYERAVLLNRNTPQALNNWGLALQELSGIVPIKDKRLIVKTAIKKFRAAISLQFDFHRAIYNLGTVLYGLAEDTMRSGGQNLGSKELTPTELYSQSAIYVAAAHALKPEYPVYKSALRLVRSKLPLAYLKTGYLSVAPEGNALAPHSDWERLWFVLDHEAFYQTDRAAHISLGASTPKETEASVDNNGMLGSNSYIFRIEIGDICGLGPRFDLSLPPGASFSIDTVHGERYLIADTWEEVDCWVDAIRLMYTIYVRGQSDVLAGIIAG